VPTYAESLEVRNRFLKALERMEDSATTPILRAYALAMQNIVADIERTLGDTGPLATAMSEAFESAPDSYRMMILQGRAEYIYEQFERFGAGASATASGLSEVAYAAGVNAVRSELDDEMLGLFSRPNKRQVEQTMAMLQPGTAQADYFAQFARTSTQDAIDTMVTSVVMGDGPEKTVSNLASKMNMGRSRLRTFVRTEVLRAARAGQSDAQRANADVLDGWVWQCAEAANTCAVCWAMNGTFHTLDEDLDSHPNCACVQLAVTKPISEINAEFGITGDEGDDTRIRPWDSDERFDETLSEDEKIRVLGPTKYAAWRDGDIRLGDLVAPTDNPVWGPGLREVTIRELRAGGALPPPVSIDRVAKRRGA
jgi:hypothetical protein